MRNKNSEIPLYQQYAEKFRNMIFIGELKKGDQIPAEIDLAKKFGVARITIRKAISELVQDDLLVRQRGKGTFVASPKIEREFVNVASFTERMQSRGMRAGSKCYSIQHMKADSKMSKHLDVIEGSDVIEIIRLRFSNDQPVALEGSYLAGQFSDIEKEDLENNSLYSLLENKYSLRPAHSSKTLEMTRATTKEAKLLQTSVGAPLFLLLATVFTHENQVMEYAKILFLGERFRFQVY